MSSTLFYTQLIKFATKEPSELIGMTKIMLNEKEYFEALEKTTLSKFCKMSRVHLVIRLCLFVLTYKCAIGCV